MVTWPGAAAMQAPTKAQRLKGPAPNRAGELWTALDYGKYSTLMRPAACVSVFIALSKLMARGPCHEQLRAMQIWTDCRPEIEMAKRAMQGC